MGATIERYVTPRNLYRYRSLRRIGETDKDVIDREPRAIEEGYLWCSDFDSMNDPMEGTYLPTSLVTRSRRFEIATQALYDGKAATGMCAFSEARNIALMWAHYADEFRGICVSYTLHHLMAGLPQTCTFTRLAYQDAPPQLTSTHNLESDVKRILSTKLATWQYEREWRLFTPQLYRNEYKQPKLANGSVGNVVSRVYIGFRMDPSVRNMIRQRLEAVKVSVWSMEKKNYDLNFRPMKPWSQAQAIRCIGQG